MIKEITYRFLNKIYIIYSNVQKWSITQQVKNNLKSCGNNLDIEVPISVLGLSYISVGNNFNVRKDFKLRAYDEFSSIRFQPEIIIGDNFYSGTQSCIAMIGKLHIGDNVTLASRVTINDHSHGKADYSDIETPVMERELTTKGPIIIEDNVWLSEGVVVLGGVSIGKNSIIAANAVVTKDIPAYSIAAGVPAKVIKTIPH